MTRGRDLGGLRAFIDATRDAVAVVCEGHTVALSEAAAALLSEFGPQSDVDTTVQELAKQTQSARAAAQSVRQNSPDGLAVGLEVTRTQYRVDDRDLVVLFMRRAPPTPSGGADLAQQKDWTVARRFAAVGQLAAGVAHEINNPAAIVMANLATLRQLLTQAGLREDGELALVNDSLEATLRIRSIVRDLQTFASIDQNELVYVDVGEVLALTCNLLGSMMRDHAAVETDFARVDRIVADRGRLAHAFSSLLLVVARRTDRATAPDATISVSCRQIDGAVAILIEASAARFTSDELTRLFEPYGPEAPVGSVTGLGLSVCAEVVHGHGGAVVGESIRGGVGARFRIELPLRSQLEVKPVRRTPPAPAPPDKDLRVLIVDDEKALLRAYRRLLRDKVTVTLASSGAEALELLHRERGFDAVLCDLMMPDMDGIQLFETVTELYPALSSRFVFSSGGAYTSRTRAFVANRSHRVVAKPVAKTALLEALAAAAQRDK